MKILVVYCSRTGTTRKVAELLASKVGATLEEIRSTVEWGGALGYLRAGKDATMRKLTTLEPSVNNPADFDLVLIGTPIWSWNLSVPVRTYLENNKSALKRVALFATMGGSGDDRAAKDLEKIIGRSAEAVLAFMTKQVLTEDLDERLAGFIDQLKLA